MRRDVVDNSKILLVDIQKGEVGETVSQLVGSIVTTKIWAAAQSRVTQRVEQRTPFFLYVDELQNFGGEGSNFTKILSEAREYRLGCWLATQYLQQLATDMRRAVVNNCRTKITFNPSGSENETQIAGMFQGLSKDQLKSLGKYRAAVQKPSEKATTTPSCSTPTRLGNPKTPTSTSENICNTGIPILPDTTFVTGSRTGRSNTRQPISHRPPPSYSTYSV